MCYVEEELMENKTIDELFGTNSQEVDYEKLHAFFNKKLNELYEKDKATPLLDYDDIRYSSMIEFIYDIMPSLKDEIDLKKS